MKTIRDANLMRVQTVQKVSTVILMIISVQIAFQIFLSYPISPLKHGTFRNFYIRRLTKQNILSKCMQGTLEHKSVNQLWMLLIKV